MNDLYFENDTPNSPPGSPCRFDYDQALSWATRRARDRAGYGASVHTMLNDDGDYRGEVAELNGLCVDEAAYDHYYDTYVETSPVWIESTPYYTMDVPRDQMLGLGDFCHGVEIKDNGSDHVEVRASSMDDLKVAGFVIKKVVEYRLG